MSTKKAVMLLGMMVMGSSALSFNDADDISNVTAATVLEELEVMQGDGRGNFMPEQPVTRAQMAIIICRILYGSKLNVNQFSGTSQYNDVGVNDYYTGYINLATSLGIINGYGDGRFGPDDTVTTAQAALMLCRALGYFQANELTGNWGTDALAAVTQATKLGLFGELNLPTNELLARDNVCEMSFNAMTKVTPVQYNDFWKMYYTDSEAITTGVKFRYDETLGYRNFKLVYTDGEDDFGNPTTIWGTSDKSLGTLKPDGSIDTTSFNNIPQTNQIVSAANKPLATYTAKVNIGTLYDLVGKSTVDDLKDVNESNAKLTVIVDGDTVVNGSKASNDVDSYFTKYSTAKQGGAGTVTNVYLDNDGAVTITMENTYVFQASGDYNSRKESIRVVTAGDTDIVLSNSELSSDDFNVVNVKDEDYLLITATKQTGGKYEVQSVRAAEVVTGTVDTYTVEDTVTINGTKYGYSATAQKGTNKVVSTSYTVGQDAAVVLDAYQNIIAVDEALTSSNYVYILDSTQVSGLSGGDVTAGAYFTDGTYKVINVVKALGETNKGSIVGTIDDTWFTYSVNGEGKYTLYDIENKYDQDIAYYQANNNTADKVVSENGKVNFSTSDGDATSGNPASSVTGTSVALNANNNTILIVRDQDDEVAAYTGVRNMPDITLKKGAAARPIVSMNYVTNESGYVVYAFVDMSSVSDNDGSVIDGAESAEFVYVLDYKSQTYIKDMGTFFTYKALIDGSTEAKEKMFDAQLLSGSDEYKLYYKARENKEGNITSLPPVPNTGKYISVDLTGEPIVYSAGTLSIVGTRYTLAPDAKITLITRQGTGLNKDKAAKYGITSVTGKGLGDTLSGLAITGNYAGELTEADKTVIKTLYVTVSSVGTSARTVVKNLIDSIIADPSGNSDWKGKMDPVGDFEVNDTTVTATYEDPGDVQGILEDVPGFLASLYDGKNGVTQITYKGNTYTWDNTVAAASKWKNGGSNTLVKDITDEALAALGLTSNGNGTWHGEKEAGSFTIKLGLNGVSYDLIINYPTFNIAAP